MPAARESLLDAARTALARRPWSAVRMIDVAAAAGVSRQTLYNEFGSKDGLARALVRREADRYLAGVERALGSSAEAGERLTAAAEWTAAAARDNALVRAMLTGSWSERLPAPPLVGVPSSSAVPAQRRADGPLPTPGDFVRIVRDSAVTALTAPVAGVPTGVTAQVGAAAAAATAPGVTDARSGAALTAISAPAATFAPADISAPAAVAAPERAAPTATSVPAATGARAAAAPTAGTAPAVSRPPAATAAPAAPSVQAATAELVLACELVVRLALSCVAAPPGEGGVAELVRAVLPRHAV